MKISLFEKLCCPQDNQDLELTVFTKNEEGEIIEGLMTCSGCHRYYPIIYGIPIMTPDEYREKALEAPMLKKWGFQLEKMGSRFLLEEHVKGEDRE